MDPIRTPRSTEAATALLQQFADLDGQIAAIEANRRECIADVNARCDRAANDLIARRDAIAVKLEPWWKAAAEKLTEGKRKSIELGGCMIGTAAGRPSLAIDGDEDAIVAKLQKRTWAEGLLRVKVTIDKVATLKALEGAYKKQLAALGFGRREGAETFFVKRTEQTGTLAGAGQ